MKIDTNQIVSISETNQNFSKVARIVDKNGEVNLIDVTTIQKYIAKLVPVLPIA